MSQILNDEYNINWLNKAGSNADIVLGFLKELIIHHLIQSNRLLMDRD